MTDPRPSPGQALDRLMRRTQAYLDAADLLSGSGARSAASALCAASRRSIAPAEPEEFISLPEWGWPRVPARARPMIAEAVTITSIRPAYPLDDSSRVCVALAILILLSAIRDRPIRLIAGSITDAGPHPLHWSGSNRHAKIAIIGDDKPFDPAPMRDFAETLIWGRRPLSCTAARRRPVPGMEQARRQMRAGTASRMSDLRVALRAPGATSPTFGHASLERRLLLERAARNETSRGHNVRRSPIRCRKPVALMAMEHRPSVKENSGLILDRLHSGEAGRQAVACAQRRTQVHRHRDRAALLRYALAAHRCRQATAGARLLRWMPPISSNYEFESAYPLGDRSGLRRAVHPGAALRDPDRADGRK